MNPEFKFGFLGGGLIAILFYADELFGTSYPAFTWVANLVIFAAIGVAVYLAMREKRTSDPATFVFAKALLTGAITCFYISVIAGGYSYAYARFVNPDKAAQVIAAKEKEWTAADKAPDFIEKQKQIIRTTYSPAGQIESTVGVIMVLGLLFSGGLALGMKKK